MLALLFVLFWLGVCGMLFGVYHERDRKPVSHCIFCGHYDAAPFGLYETDAEIRDLVGDFIPHNAPVCGDCRTLALGAAKAAIAHGEKKHVV
jgi:hypothetical protein